MARAATTTDVFNAVAEPRRREVIGHLARRECTVNDLVRALGLAQPAVSKHLHVLRQVGVVTVRAAGRHHYYRLEARSLKPIHDWVTTYQRLWDEQFDKLDKYLESREETEPPHA